MLDKTGVPTEEMIRSKFPPLQVLMRPKAVLECYEDIPCNPCATNCPFHAITIADGLNSQPVLDYDRCTGCGVCISVCPGLAITVVQIINDKARFRIPYEFLPVPVPGETWPGVNRRGEVITDGKIVKVTTNKNQDKTVVVTVDVDKRFIHDFITIKVPR